MADAFFRRQHCRRSCRSLASCALHLPRLAQDIWRDVDALRRVPPLCPAEHPGRAPDGGVARSEAASERAHGVRCSEGAALRRSPTISGLGSGCESNQQPRNHR